MTSSPEYLQLCKRIAQLRRHFLPAVFDPTGTYSPLVQDQTRAFVALVHAEIEFYIETRASNVAAKRIQEWIKNRNPNAVCFSLIAICYTGWTELGGKQENLSKLTKQIQIEARLNDAGKQYKQVIDSNNGIKLENLRHLLIPLSIRENDIGDDWFNAMSDFGTKRGQIAHQAGHINLPPDPKDTFNTVWKTLVPGLRKLDLIFNQLEV